MKKYIFMLLAAIFFAATAFANDSIPASNDGPTIEKATEINIDQTESSIRTLDYIIIGLLILIIVFIFWDVFISKDTDKESIEENVKQLKKEIDGIENRLRNSHLDWIYITRTDVDKLNSKVNQLLENAGKNTAMHDSPNPKKLPGAEEPGEKKMGKNDNAEDGKQDNEKKEPASKPKGIKKLYVDSPESNGGFFYAVFEDIQDSNVFVIFEDAESNIAEFDVLYEHPKAVSKILSDPDPIGHDCCDFIKVGTSAYQHLETKKKGVAEKLPSNGKWKVKEKAQIKIS